MDDRRREFAALAMQDGAKISGLCRTYGIPRTTGYAVLERARRDGLDRLTNRSRRPHRSPNQTPAELEELVVTLRLVHPTWGARKLKAWFAAHDLAAPAMSTITAILHRHDLIDRERPAVAAYGSYERPAPNDLWQMDFMGHRPLRQGRVHPLTIIDDHSRFNLLLAACGNEQQATVRAQLDLTLRTYGLPWEILVDNGPAWGHSGGAVSRFTVDLMRLGITVIHGRPMHPQTQGKVERLHKTISTDVFGPLPFADLDAAQRAFAAFRSVYNLERPHEALNDRPPMTRYQISSRPYPEQIPEPAYDERDLVRIVQQKGDIAYRGRRLPVGEAFAGERVALRPTQTDGVLTVRYYNQEVTVIDLR